MGLDERGQPKVAISGQFNVNGLPAVVELLVY